MKTKIHLTSILLIFVFGFTYSQTQKAKLTSADTAFFNYAYWNGVADKRHYTAEERKEWIAGQKNIYLQELQHQHIEEKDLAWVSEAPPSSQKGYGQNTTNAGPCTNIDFESGSFTGWTRSTGFNPLSNATGCCPNPNGDQTIMTGAANDPFGGFPVVYPGGGSFSLRLGSTTTGGIADRISQTFFVTPANANFTYRYAVVLNDPGHPVAQQPRFISEIIDTLGNPIPCTTYSVAAGGTIPGFTTSATNANGGAVRCKSWTDVAVDLTPNIGQNVTIRFTVYDCGPTGHFAYAYIDGLCTNFATSIADTTCPSVPFAMCAPAGFAATTWNGPGVASNTNQCIVAVIPGVYTCTTLLGPGCPGPTFTHTLTTLPPPIVSFTSTSTGPCATQYTFNGNIGISSGSIVSHQWYFGDGATATGLNQVHNYAAPGTYAVKLKALSNRGCVDSVVNFVTIFPPPSLAFSPPSNCINTLIQFTNTSNIPVGTITSYTWNFFGNGANTNVVNPTNTYTAAGVYSIALTAISNQGCSATLTQTLGIFPPPIISFSANPLCDINGTSFSPATSTAISSGSLATFFWDFGDGGTSTLANPVHIYAAPGLYTVNFSAVSNHNCPSTTSNTFIISPSPTVAFSPTTLNNCSPNYTFTNNSSISSGPISYTWNFAGSAGTNTTTATSPQYIFPTIGNYTVTLIGMSSLGCGDTATQLVSVYPYPIINFSVPASCESAIFTVSTTAVSGSVTSYSWDFGDPASGAANTSTIQNPTHFYGTTGDYTISLNLISNLNCPSTTITTIKVYPNPVAAFTYTTLNNCSLNFSYTNNSSVVTPSANSITSSTWNFGGASTSTLFSPGTVSFPSNGIYTVSLISITNNNCSDTAVASIMVHPFPQLSFSVEPTCANLPVTFTTSSSISAIPSPTSSITSYTFGYGDNVFSTVASPPAHTYSSSGTYTASYVAISNMGCISSVVNTVQIYAIPVVDFTTSSGLCFGNLTQFTSTTSIASGSLFAYNWDYGDGSFGSNPSSSHTYSAAGNYPVTYSVSSNNECMTVLTKTVTVFPLPVVSYTSNGGCLNVQTMFTGTATIPIGSIISYSYNFGDGNGAPNQVQAHTYTVHGTYTPTLTAMSNQSCVASVINSVVIHPLPNISFSPQGACVGSAIQFTNTSSIPLGSINSYVWNFSDGTPTTTVVNPIHTFTANAVYPVTVTATSNQNCTNTAVNNVTIHPYPQLTLTPIQNACVGQQAQINLNITIPGSNNPISGYTLSYGDGSPTYTTANLTNIANDTIPHAYNGYNTYTLVATAISNGCAASTFSTIQIYPNPFTSFVANNFCLGQQTQFVNTSTIAPGYSITEHYWFFDNGANTSTSSATQHTFTAPGQYSVSLTEFSYPEAGLTCSSTAVNVITINPVPGSNFSVNTVCDGSPTSFTNLSNSPVATTLWSWYFYGDNTPLSSVSQNPIHTYTTAGTYTFSAKLKAQNSFGCRDSVNKTVQLYINPTASFVPTDACLNENNLFPSGTSTLGSGSIASYSWNFAGQGSSTLANPSYSFANPGTYSVQLTITDELGCSGKYTTSVTVNPLPTVTFTANQSCLNTVTQFTNQSSGNIVSYNWNFGDIVSGPTNTSTAIAPNHLYSNTGIFTASLLATTNKNCSAQATRTVVVHGIPLASFNNTTICVGDNLSFPNLSTSPDGTISTHQWDFNGDNFYDQEGISPTYSYVTSATYSVKLLVTTQYGCSDDTAMQVFANPKAIAAITSDKRAGCPTLCINLKDISTIASGSFTTTWDFGDGSPINTIKNTSHCYESGNYDISLTLVSDVGCVTRFKNQGYVSVFPVPKAGFEVNPPEIDEDEPVINITNQSSADAEQIKYFVSDGSSFGTPDFTHYIKNLKQTKPMVVQIVKNKSGCADTLYKVLDIKPAYVIYFPDVFTPNGDGVNDTFMPKGVGIIKFTLQIFDRWGHQVFKTNDITEMWDGAAKNNDNSVKQDIYTWKAQVTDVFNKNHFLVGHVSVLR